MLQRLKKFVAIATISTAISVPTATTFTQQKVNAQNNPGVFACGSGFAANRNCFRIVGNTYTWVQSIAENDCRRRFGGAAVAQRTFIPYIFVCGVPTGRWA